MKKFFIFIFLILVFVSANTAFAAGLEVEYPALTAPGYTVPTSADTPLPDYLKYIFGLGMFLGFAFVFYTLAAAGVLYFFAPAFPDAYSKAKDRVAGAISGLLILLTCYLIFTTINPQLRFFSMDPLPPAPQTPPPDMPPGVYLYKSADCSGEGKLFTASAQNLGTGLNNQVNSIKIIQGATNDEKYIAVIYRNPGEWGKCQYIDPNAACQPVAPFAESLSVYRYSFESSAQTTFHRYSFFNKDGGFKTISASEILIQDLREPIFGEVPKKELRLSACAKYDIKNSQAVCVEEGEMDLGGENTTSFKIDGDYMALIVYFDDETAKTPETDSANGPWTFCQAFPLSSDANQKGPVNIKWDHARQIIGGLLPNYALLFPIKK